jgi:cell wall-associated NlpC family hydrolase
VRAYRRFRSRAGKGTGCLAVGAGCLIVPVLCLLLVGGIIVGVLNPGASPASAGTYGFSDFALKDIPAEYVALYQAAAAAYPGLPAPLIAAVGKIESDHGRDRGAGVHQPAHPDHLLGMGATDRGALANFAGAAGPMQVGIGGAATRNFQGSHAWGGLWERTWHGAIHPAAPAGAAAAVYGYGVDAGGDGFADVYDPADAIFTGARMLYTAWDKKAGDLWKAVYAYNHGGGSPNRQDGYVTKVLGVYDQYLGAAPVSDDNGTLGGRIVAAAVRWLGTPYVFGGGNDNGPTGGGFDCSGLTKYAVYQATGHRVSLQHYVPYQWDDPHVHKVPYSQLQPGDLIAMHDWGHEGIYIGGGKMIHAPHTGDVVKISDITRGWYRAVFVTGGRVIL